MVTDTHTKLQVVRVWKDTNHRLVLPVVDLVGEELSKEVLEAMANHRALADYFDAAPSKTHIEVHEVVFGRQYIVASKAACTLVELKRTPLRKYTVVKDEMAKVQVWPEGGLVRE